MRLLLIIDDYLPDSTRVHAKMMHELALRLKGLGYDVIVVAPMTQCTKKLSIDHLDGIDIYRFPSGRIRSKSKVKRAINETLLSFRAWFALSSVIKKNKIDGVIYYSPSIFWGPLVYKIKKRWNCPAYLILRDLFPQWIIDAGIIKDRGLIAYYFKFWEKINYSVADHIGLMSTKNISVFSYFYPDIKKTSVLYNWAEPKVEEPFDVGHSFRNRLQLNDKVIFFYGGNIGHAQDMSNLLRLAISMKKYPEAHFLFVGEGDEVELLEETITKHNLTNCSYLPSIPQLEYKKLLNEVDIGLFSLAKTHTAHNFPGKILGYMVNSLPILGSVNPENDLLELINESHAGAIFINGDDIGLLNAAKCLLLDKKERDELGYNSFTLLLNKFSAESAANNIMDKLNYE